MSNEQTVKDVYAAFQRGDVAAIIARVADDVDWRNDRVESRECPWNGNFSGKTNLPGFFKVLGEHLDFSVFDVRAIAASGWFVAVHPRMSAPFGRMAGPSRTTPCISGPSTGAGRLLGIDTTTTPQPNLQRGAADGAGDC